MSDISATVTSQPISATVTAAGVSANVTSSSAMVTIAGGVGPQGPQGLAGTPASLEQVPGVSITNAQAGDVLQYGGSNKWQNNPIIDGGNFLWPVLFAFVDVL
jgi:hypothetical protein